MCGETFFLTKFFFFFQVGMRGMTEFFVLDIVYSTLRGRDPSVLIILYVIRKYKYMQFHIRLEGIYLLQKKKVLILLFYTPVQDDIFNNFTHIFMNAPTLSIRKCMSYWYRIIYICNFTFI